MKLMFFFKYSELDVIFRNAMKNPEKVCSFLDNCISIFLQEILQILTRILSSGVMVLTNIAKTSDLTKSHFFRLILSQINGKVS